MKKCQLHLVYENQTPARRCTETSDWEWFASATGGNVRLSRDIGTSTCKSPWQSESFLMRAATILVEMARVQYLTWPVGTCLLVMRAHTTNKQQTLDA